MVEAYITIDDTMEYYKCSDFPFNFFFITDLPRDYDREVTAEDVANVITLWMGSMDAEKTANWVVSDHMNSRFILNKPAKFFWISWEITTNGELGAGTARLLSTLGI